MPPKIGAELIYSFVIIICSLMVYYGTKELYELISYRWIKYFRQAFLFFAIAYFFRYSIRFILSFFNIRTMHEFLPMSLGPLGPLTLFFFMYFSAMAVFYLLYSVMWKRWNGNSKMIYVFHAVAVIISLVSIISRRSDVLLEINILLLMIILFVYYVAHKDSKTKKINRANKIKIWRKIYGYSQKIGRKVYLFKGMVEKKLGMGAFISALENSKEIIDYLNKSKASYTYFDVWVE